MFQVEFADGAERDLTRLDARVRERIFKRIQWLAHNAATVRHVALTGTLNDLYKLRVGDYRVLYDLVPSHQVLLVHRIRHRREVYGDK